MRTKSAYREKSNEIPAPNIPAIKIDGEQPEATVGMAAHIPAEDGAVDIAVASAEQAATDADAAKLALVRQIEALKQSEQLQRQRHAAMAHAQRPTHDQLLQHWRANNNMSEADENFLRENPAMIDNSQLAALAATEAAQQGHARDTDAHRQATKAIFDQRLAHLQAQARANSAPQEPPKFFKPAPPPAPPDRAAMYSAPVSREVPTGAYREPSPSSVTLSQDQLAIAAASGISPVEYARNLLKLEAQKRRGERQL